jgi:hypothetical protein
MSCDVMGWPAALSLTSVVLTVSPFALRLFFPSMLSCMAMDDWRSAIINNDHDIKRLVLQLVSVMAHRWP